MEFSRSNRVAESIHKEVSSLLLKGLKDPRVGFVTITAVDVTRDLRHARIYFSVIGDENERENAQKGLNSSASYIRRELGQRLRMRYVPEIQFKYDSSLEYGNRIESLIREIHSDSTDDQGDTEDN